MSSPAAAAAAAAPRVVLVTGGSGLVGHAMSALIAREAPADERWHFCTSKDADLRDKAEVWALFERLRPTHVVHLAAFVGGLFKNLRAKVEFYRFK